MDIDSILNIISWIVILVALLWTAIKFVNSLGPILLGIRVLQTGAFDVLQGTREAGEKALRDAVIALSWDSFYFVLVFVIILGVYV